MVCGPVDELLTVEFDEKFAKQVDYQIHRAAKNVLQYHRHRDKYAVRRAAYYAEHKERSKELRQKWVKEHPEEHNAARRAYYRKNTAAILARQKAWHSNNKSKDKVWAHAYYLKNIEKVKARTKEYRRTHGDPRIRTGQPSGSSVGIETQDQGCNLASNVSNA